MSDLVSAVISFAGIVLAPFGNIESSMYDRYEAFIKSSIFIVAALGLVAMMTGLRAGQPEVRKSRSSPI